MVLVGLACKNAILIVEFARDRQHEGVARFDAAVEAARTRLRPIMMTSFAFILGVVPLVVAQGAGAEMRRSLGTAVFAGMLGVTLFGIFLTPVFYRSSAGLRRDHPSRPPTPHRLKSALTPLPRRREHRGRSVAPIEAVGVSFSCAFIACASVRQAESSRNSLRAVQSIGLAHRSWGIPRIPVALLPINTSGFHLQ